MDNREHAKAKPPFPLTAIEDVFGSMKYDGPVLSLDDMDAAIRARAKRRRRC